MTLGLSELGRLIARGITKLFTPAPRLQNQIQSSHLPKAEPTADEYNRNICKDLKKGILKPSYEAAFKEALTELREQFGADAVPQDMNFRNFMNVSKQRTIENKIKTMPTMCSTADFKALILQHGHTQVCENVATSLLLQQDQGEPKLTKGYLNVALDLVAQKYPLAYEALIRASSSEEVAKQLTPLRDSVVLVAKGMELENQLFEDGLARFNNALAQASGLTFGELTKVFGNKNSYFKDPVMGMIASRNKKVKNQQLDLQAYDQNTIRQEMESKITKLIQNAVDAFAVVNTLSNTEQKILLRNVMLEEPGALFDKKTIEFALDKGNNLNFDNLRPRFSPHQATTATASDVVQLFKDLAQKFVDTGIYKSSDDLTGVEQMPIATSLMQILYTNEPDIRAFVANLNPGILNEAINQLGEDASNLPDGDPMSTVVTTASNMLAEAQNQVKAFAKEWLTDAEAKTIEQDTAESPLRERLSQLLQHGYTVREGEESLAFEMNGLELNNQEANDAERLAEPLDKVFKVVIGKLPMQNIRNARMHAASAKTILRSMSPAAAPLMQQMLTLLEPCSSRQDIEKVINTLDKMANSLVGLPEESLHVLENFLATMKPKTPQAAISAVADFGNILAGLNTLALPVVNTLITNLHFESPSEAKKTLTDLTVSLSTLPMEMIPTLQQYLGTLDFTNTDAALVALNNKISELQQ